MLTFTMYTMSSMEDKTCRCELKMQTFMCSCAQWYAWNIFFLPQMYTQKVIIALKMCTRSWTMNYIKNKVNCSYGSIMEKLYGKLSVQQHSIMYFFPFNIVDFFYVVSRILILRFHKSTESIQRNVFYENDWKLLIEDVKWK